MELKIIDAHLHLWDLNQLHYPWLAEVPEINKTSLADAFQKQTSGRTPVIEKMVFVQCECLPSQYLEEVDLITRQASLDPRIQGVVSWFPLEAEDAQERLSELTKNPLIKGVRRLEETPASLFRNPLFLRNLSLLPQSQLSFDICAKNHLLGTAIEMVDHQPEVRYMLDHLGKPDIKNGEMQTWKTHIRLLAQNPNVYAKVSGLVTEADPKHWRVDNLRPYFDYALEQFGIGRLVFGGDWPVLTLAASYQQWFATVVQLCDGLSEDDLHQLFYQNACDFYQLV
jgi:L-fuconolactonase